MNFDNDEESLEFINRLLERLHQADYKSLGSINVNIFKPGSQHVDRVENQYIGAYPQPLPKGKESKTEKEHKQTSGDLAGHLRHCFILLVQEQYGEEPLFNQQSHWQAVYRILVDKGYCRDLDAALKACGMARQAKFYTPKEVSLIVEFLGEP